MATDRPDRIKLHIEEVFADKPVGTFLTIAEIRKVKTSAYPDDPPGAGAITARLFPARGGSSFDTVEGDYGRETNRRGGRKWRSEKDD